MLYYKSVKRSYINIHYFYVHNYLSPVEVNFILLKYKVDSFKNKTGLMVHFKDFNAAYEKWLKMRFKKKERIPKIESIDKKKCYYLNKNDDNLYTRVAFISGKRRFYREYYVSCSTGGQHFKYLIKNSDILNLLKDKRYDLEFEGNNTLEAFSKQESSIIKYFCFLYNIKFRNERDKFRKIADYLGEKGVIYVPVISRMWDK